MDNMDWIRIACACTGMTGWISLFPFGVGGLIRASFAHKGH